MGISKENAIDLLNGLKANQSLKTLIFDDIKIEALSQELLAEGIYLNPFIETLQFQNCTVCKDFGAAIKKIISKHAEKNNEAKWLNGLRGDVDESQGNSGLSCISIRNCNLTNAAASLIVNALSFDQYIQSVDLSFNCIEEEPIREIVGLLKSSIHIVNFDLRGNPGYNVECSKTLIFRLLKNISRIKKDPKVLMSLAIPIYQGERMDKQRNAQTSSAYSNYRKTSN